MGDNNVWDKERLAKALLIDSDSKSSLVSNALEALKTSPVLEELPSIIKHHKPRKRRDYRCGKCGMVKKNHNCNKVPQYQHHHSKSEKRKSYKPLKLVLVENDQPETRQHLMEIKQIGETNVQIQLFVVKKRAPDDFDIVVQAVYGTRPPVYIGKVSWYYKPIVRAAIEDNSITKVDLLQVYEVDDELLTTSTTGSSSPQSTPPSTGATSPMHSTSPMHPANLFPTATSGSFTINNATTMSPFGHSQSPADASYSLTLLASPVVHPNAQLNQMSGGNAFAGFSSMALSAPASGFGNSTAPSFTNTTTAATTRKILTAQLGIHRNQSWHTKKLSELPLSSPPSSLGEKKSEDLLEHHIPHQPAYES
jgi:hypothetical protein